MLVILSLLAGWKLGAMQFFTMTGAAVPFYQPYSQIQLVAPMYLKRGWDMLAPAIILYILAYVAAYSTVSNHKNSWLDAPDWERWSES